MTALSPELEDIAKDLIDKSCSGSEELWPEIDEKSLKSDHKIREKFYCLAHQGMRDAQNFILDQVTSTEHLTVSQEILFRGIADSIAWQLLGNQLCHARRLYKGHNNPDLKNSNLGSVISVAHDLTEKYPNSIALISDLTSFIQVGDVFFNDLNKGMSIIEVKEGRENKRISEFLEFYSESKCDRALHYFINESSPHSIKQMSRMLRQADRMSHFTQIMSTGDSTDPDTGQKIHIPEEEVHIDTWDSEINDLIGASKERGWAIDTIDNCLFVGCYSKEPMIVAGHVAFNTWFDGCGGNNNSPRGRLFDAMKIPLALPIMNRMIPVKSKIDLLFGRMQICMGINIDSLISECKDAGLKVRIGSNKETSQLEQKGIKPFRHNGGSLYIGSDNKESPLLDGIFLRAMYHGQKPISIIRSFLQ